MRRYIYFDENACNENGWYNLRIQGSLRDIDRLSGKLMRGMKVTLIDPSGGFQLEAELEFDETWRCWYGKPVGVVEYLVPAYWLTSAEAEEATRLISGNEFDQAIDLIQNPKRECAPWDKPPWWLSRSLVGHVLEAVLRFGINVPKSVLIGPAWQVMSLSRQEAFHLGEAIAHLLKEKPQEMFITDRYPGVPDVGRLAASYIRDACQIPELYDAVAIFPGWMEDR